LKNRYSDLWSVKISLHPASEILEKIDFCHTETILFHIHCIFHTNGLDLIHQSLKRDACHGKMTCMIKKKIWELKEEIIGTRGRYMLDKTKKSQPWIKLMGLEILTRGSEGFSF